MDRGEANGGRRERGGSLGGGEPPEPDFNRILARLVRYFGQSPDYWLDTCTLRDWTDIWSRELVEAPPVDDLAAWYLKYEPPVHQGTGSQQAAEVDLGLPEFEE